MDRWTSCQICGKRMDYDSLAEHQRKCRQNSSKPTPPPEAVTPAPKVAIPEHVLRAADAIAAYPEAYQGYPFIVAEWLRGQWPNLPAPTAQAEAAPAQTAFLLPIRIQRVMEAILENPEEYQGFALELAQFLEENGEDELPPGNDPLSVAAQPEAVKADTGAPALDATFLTQVLGWMIGADSFIAQEHPDWAKQGKKYADRLSAGIRAMERPAALPTGADTASRAPRNEA